MPEIVGGIPSSDGGVPLSVHQVVLAGNDYKAIDGRALSWSSGAFPDLAGASLSMVVGHEDYNLYGDLPVTWTGSVPDAPDAPTTITLDVAAAQTSAFPEDEYNYVLTATLTDGDRYTVAIGMLTVQANPGSLPLYPPAV